MHILLFAASLRTDSLNKKLIELTAQLVGQQGVSVDLAEFSEFDLPLYNYDIEAQQGIPAAAIAFVQRLQQAKGLIIASPEYNFSIPGTLKNLIDWVSRISPMPWRSQRILLLSASPSLVGGNRGLWHTRVPLEACGAHVFPDMFSLSSAHQAFTAEGSLQDQQLQARLQALLVAFLAFLNETGSVARKTE